MKVFTAASILGLLSAPALGANRDTFEVEEGGVRFKVSRFVDGRPTPYRVYFWDEHLSGSSYRLDTEGHVVYFKAGSEAYHDRMEMDDESLTYSMKMEHPDRRSARTPANHAEGFLPDSDCSICTMTWDAVCGVGLPMFCDKVRRHSLGDDGLDSVELLCGNQEGACAKAKGLCEYVCAPQQGPTCENGVVGIQASNGACCAAGCGQCGGVGCSSFGNALGLDKYDCCATEIVDMGKPCSETHKAPCFIGDGGSDESSDESVDDNTSMMCDNGFVGLQASNGACCPVGCGQCGGVGCSSFGNALGLDKHDCCATEIVDMGKSCSEVDQAPCFCDIDHSADAPTDDLREVIMGSEDEDSMEAMDAKCNRSSLTAADLEGLDVYDFDMYIEPLCMVNNQLPNGCNMMGLGQGCRGCYTTCEGALYYIEMHEQEIKEKGEDAIINFCPFSEVMSLDSCRQA